jgi:acylphosphatase
LSNNEETSNPASGQGVHWFISGRVQGVGFRYHVADAARRHAVRGDVRNLPDGRVELRAAGDDLNDFLAEVRQGPYGSRVDDVESQPLDPALVFNDFQIRF